MHEIRAFYSLRLIKNCRQYEYDIGFSRNLANGVQDNMSLQWFLVVFYFIEDGVLI